ncbi:UNVERIFIED_CONTAM: hypothetical protein K2H54_027729 [Gekko kuhli]
MKPSFGIRFQVERFVAIPKEAATSNEFQCPACRNATDETCMAEVVPCQGDENFCANSTVKILNEDKTENSTLVIKGCVPQLVLSALLGTKDVEPGFIYEIQNTIGVAARRPTEPPTTVKPTEKTTTDPPKTTTETSNSPHISSSLSFALWLPSMFWLLLMTLLF